MELNQKFDIKSESLGDLYRKMSRKELIYDPFYQRKFVWEEKHQIEYIKTILLGLPCPEIFLAEGNLDLETHTIYTHVIDGQQRLRTIEMFFDNKLQVDGKYYKELEDPVKISLNQYHIGVVKLKYNPEQEYEEIAEIFRRLNFGNYELTETEKTISKFSDNELVLLARFISNDLLTREMDDEDDEQSEMIKNIKSNPFLSESFKRWVFDKDFTDLKTFFLSREIYSNNEIKRNNNSKDAIDMIGILVNGKFHSRVLSDEEIIRLTPKVTKEKEVITNKFLLAINIFNKIIVPEIEGFKKRKYLYIRSNAFSLFVTLLLNYDLLPDIDIEKFNKNLMDFCENLPEDFIIAARNSNMDKKQREIRHNYLEQILKNSLNE